MIEINDESRETYDTNSQIKFKTTMLKPIPCDNSEAYILVTETITVAITAFTNNETNNINKKVVFKNCASFTNCTNKIKKTQVDDAKELDIMMLMYNLNII